MAHRLHSFFWPQSIVVLGASADLHDDRGGGRGDRPGVDAILAASVVPAVEECARAAVRNALVISSGFVEGARLAADLRSELLPVVRRTGIQVCGPNCGGYYNALGRVATKP